MNMMKINISGHNGPLAVSAGKATAVSFGVPRAMVDSAFAWPRPRIYVSGASAECDMVQRWLRKLAVVGYECATRARLAETDEQAISSSQVFWLLAPGPCIATVGAWVELGVARGCRRWTGTEPTIVVSGRHEATIFSEQADRRFPSHEQAFAWLVSRLTKGGLN